MSYLHCPTCACAYNVAREPACPRCGLRLGAGSDFPPGDAAPADPTADVIAAVEQLARAMARATPIELIAAQSTLDARTSQLALPAPGQPAAPSPALLRAVRAALEPPAPAQPPNRFAALFAHLPPELRTRWRGALDAMLARLAPRLPAIAGAPNRLARATSRVRSSLRALFA